MYLVKLYADISHTILVREDRYLSIQKAAYFLGRNPATIYNFIRGKTKGNGILRFIELNRC